jgi:hypothetical protein
MRDGSVGLNQLAHGRGVTHLASGGIRPDVLFQTLIDGDLVSRVDAMLWGSYVPRSPARSAIATA